MPLIPKTWLGYPPNTSTPLNPAALVGLEQRVGNYLGAVGSVGPGVDNYESFRVKQHGAGDMSVDVGLPNVIMAGFIALDTNGGVERYEYNGPQLNQLISTADATNPRIDQIVLVPGITDSQAPTIAVVTGTPTAGATLANRNGAAVVPAQRIRLADVLVGAGATQILTASIRDRRPMGMYGGSPMAPPNNPVIPLIDQVILQAPPAFLAPQQGGVFAANSNYQIAVAVFLPRRVVATRIRWAYIQNGAAAAVGNYAIGIFDASGQAIVSTATTAFTGAANSYNVRNEPITATTFEAGWYHQVMGFSAITGSANWYGWNLLNALNGGQVAVQGTAFVRSSGGVTLPTNFVDGGLQDVYSLGTIAPPVMPVMTLAAA